MLVKYCVNPGHQGPNPLPISEFSKHSRSSDGLYCWCKACKNRANRAQTDPENNRARALRWAKDNPESMNTRTRKHKDKIRDQVFGHYGRSCACCGSTRRLTIDHVNGDGGPHRQELFGNSHGGVDFYRWLIKQGFPAGYQTLCSPCNNSKKAGPACRLKH